MKLILLPVFFLFCIETFAANNTLCGNGRYDTEIFSNVTVTNDIVYGSNDWILLNCHICGRLELQRQPVKTLVR